MEEILPVHFAAANVSKGRGNRGMLASMSDTPAEVRTMQSRILIADDQPDVLKALCLLLKGHGYTTETVTSPADLLDALGHAEFDLLLMDLNYARDTTSGREGLDLLAHLKALDGIPPIVVMTGWATVGIAVEAMQRGVTDFVEKPWTNSQLLEVLSKQITLGRERRESARLAVQETQAHKVIVTQFHEQEHEIAEARAIQEGFLPKEIPQLAGYEIAAAWQSARVVGGDYFDVLPFDGEMCGLCIADVAGKGLGAALLTTMLQGALSGMTLGVDPVTVFSHLNQFLCGRASVGRYATMFFGLLDADGTLEFVRAGHPSPLLLRRGEVSELYTGGSFPIGLIEQATFNAASIQLEPEDTLLLYSDGVTEAEDIGQELFGDARLKEALGRCQDPALGAVQTEILSAVDKFAEGASQSDDITILVVRYRRPVSGAGSSGETTGIHA